MYFAVFDDFLLKKIVLKYHTWYRAGDTQTFHFLVGVWSAFPPLYMLLTMVVLSEYNESMTMFELIELLLDIQSYCTNTDPNIKGCS